MTNNLLVHPRPLPGESLSSFLLRVAHENSISLVDLWSMFNNKFKKTHLKDVHQLDMDPYRVSDVPKLVNLVCLDDQLVVNRMTFHPLFSKFLDDEELESDKTRRDFCQTLIDTTNRRFCPDCLVENPVYKLLWQVKEVEICPTHGKKLESHCPHCGRKQDLVHESLAEAKCKHCFGNLWETRNVENLTVDNIADHLKVYETWQSLIDSNIKVVPDIVQSRRKSLAVSLLFVAQQDGDESIHPKSQA